MADGERDRSGEAVAGSAKLSDDRHGGEWRINYKLSPCLSG